MQDLIELYQQVEKGVNELNSSLAENVDDNKLQPKSISFFSTLFLISLMYFQQKQCEYLCIEAGIGGANSVTNILDADVSSITSVGYDH